LSSSRMMPPVAALLAVLFTAVLMFSSRSVASGVIVGLLDLIFISIVYFAFMDASRRSATTGSGAELSDVLDKIARGENPDLSKLPESQREAFAALASRMEVLTDEIDELSPRDRLTSLAKEEVFNNVLWREFNRAQRYAEPLSLALVQIDSLASLRESSGQQACDEVLKEVASIVLRMIRETDLAARYGDDRLAIIMPGTDTNGANDFCRRFRRLLDEQGQSLQQVGGEMEVSVGAASLPEEGTKTAPELVQKAASALKPRHREDSTGV